MRLQIFYKMLIELKNENIIKKKKNLFESICENEKKTIIKLDDVEIKKNKKTST